MSFTDRFNMELLEKDENHIYAKMMLKDEYKNVINSLHGGMTATFADSVAGYLASGENYMSPTNSFNLYYLRPILFEEGEYMYAKANVVKRGKKIIIIDCDIYDNDENLCARSTFSFSVVERPETVKRI